METKLFSFLFDIGNNRRIGVIKATSEAEATEIFKKAYPDWEKSDLALLNEVSFCGSVAEILNGPKTL